MMFTCEHFFPWDVRGVDKGVDGVRDGIDCVAADGVVTTAIDLIGVADETDDTFLIWLILILLIVW